MTPLSPKIKAFAGIRGIEEADWSQLTDPNFPFTDYAFLAALEASGSAGEPTGWTPHYLTAWNDDTLEGASFLYEKDNSYGEYIFDWDWAEAYQAHGVAYFPKLTSAVPFTPATGRKLLIAPTTDRKLVAARLIQAAKGLMEQRNCSSLHYLFLAADELPFFEAEGFLIRHSFQYHWKNQGYANFSEFLETLKPRKKKQILREREQLADAHLTIRILTGDDLRPEHADVFHQFYLSTIEKMRAIPYLNLEFFRSIFSLLRDEVVLILAEEQHTAIAGALYYKKGDSLFGRYWGAHKDVRNLHFEICYYQPLEWAIAHKFARFEAGAQGDHKLSRGFLPELTFSAHFIRHAAFREAIARYITHEKEALQKLFEEMKPHHPFRVEVIGEGPRDYGAPLVG